MEEVDTGVETGGERCGNDDQELLAERRKVSMGYNRNIKCKTTPWLLLHKCNKKVGVGMVYPSYYSFSSLAQ